MGHPTGSIFSKLLTDLAFHGTASIPFCKYCQLAKGNKLPFSISHSTTTTKPLKLIHSDVWGPSLLASICGFKYYVLFIDDFSRYTWFFPLHCKSDVYSVFVDFKLKVENMLNNKIKFFRSDGGGEFVNTKFKLLFKQCGILHQFSCPHTPEQNGCAERKHRHLVETGLSLLFHAGLPLVYWPDAFSIAIYLINRMPMRSLHFLSPWQTLFYDTPNSMILRVFGCACYLWLCLYSLHKLEPRTTQCVFLGYSLNYKGYKCLDPTTGKVYMSRHVVFDESSFPLKTPSLTTSPNSPFTLLISKWISPPVSILGPYNVPSIPCSPPTAPASPLSSTLPSVTFPSSPPPTVPPSTVTPSLVPVIAAPCLLAESSTLHHMVTRSKFGISKKKVLCASKHIVFLPSHVYFDSVEPSCYIEASKQEHWRRAMSKEFSALQRQGIWSLVPSHPSQHIVGCRWVYKIKHHPDGSIARYKARSVAKGFHQAYGIDYTNTFSPVVKHSTIQVVLALVVHLQWPLHQLDITNAFLHGLL